MSRVERHSKRMKLAAKNPGPWREMLVTPEIRAEAVHLKHLSKRYYTGALQVDIFNTASSIGGVVHAVVLRHGVLAMPTNEELQNVKNQLFGPELEAVEVFPANWPAMPAKVRHLWILPGHWKLPFGHDMPNPFGGSDGVGSD